MDAIKALMSTLYPEHSYQIDSTFLEYQTLKLRGKVHGSYRRRSKNSSIVFADLRGETRPARINFFACVSVKVNEVLSKVIVVSLNWFKSHPLKEIRVVNLLQFGNMIYLMITYLQTKFCVELSLSLIN